MRKNPFLYTKSQEDEETHKRFTRGTSLLEKEEERVFETKKEGKEDPSRSRSQIHDRHWCLADGSGHSDGTSCFFLRLIDLNFEGLFKFTTNFLNFIRFGLSLVKCKIFNFFRFSDDLKFSNCLIILFF